MLDFEWDDDKAVANVLKHGIAFDDARLVFGDLFASHFVDRSMDYGEERFIAIGMCNGVVLTVIYAERGERLRMISARKATRYEQKIYDAGRDSG